MSYLFGDKRSTPIDLAGLKKYSFEMGAIRPPSEGGSASLLIRATRNCPWNKCAFCYGGPYNHARFELRPVEEVKRDIDAAKAIASEIKALSWRMGYGGDIGPVGQVLQGNLMDNRELRDLTGAEQANLFCIVTVFNWLTSGGKTVFLQDADTPIMRTNELVEVIKYLKESFPSVERVTSYARSKTVNHKKPEELKELRDAGLVRLHIGLETGDAEVLEYVQKGVIPDEHILAGKKALAAGFQLSEYVMPGLGGKKWWAQHATGTAHVLNEINPHFIRLRPFVPQVNTPMLAAYESGEFQLTSAHERLEEIKLMVENLTVTSRLCFDHSRNTAFWSGSQLIHLMSLSYEGYKLPEEKQKLLDLIARGLEFDEGIFLQPQEMMKMPG